MWSDNFLFWKEVSFQGVIFIEDMLMLFVILEKIHLTTIDDGLEYCLQKNVLLALCKFIQCALYKNWKMVCLTDGRSFKR